MGETIFKVLLGELKVVRLTCRHCNVAIEMSLDKLERAFSGDHGGDPGSCPYCGGKVLDDDRVLGDLAKAVNAAQKLSNLTCEFVLPDPSNRE